MQNPHRSAVLDTKPIHSAFARPKSMPSWLPDTNLSDLSLLEDDYSSGILIDNGYVLEGPTRLVFVRFLGAGAFGYVFLAQNLDWVEPTSASTGDVEGLSLPESQSSHLEAMGAPASLHFDLHIVPLIPPLPVATKSEGTSFSTLTTPLLTYPYYAVKCLDNNATTHEQRQREIQNHLVVQGHESIVKLYATVYEDEWTFLILEYVDGGDMRRSMARHNIYATCDVRLGEVFGRVVDAVRYCHQKGVYHRDLKPENIMCQNGGLKVALGDFECAGQGYLAHGLIPPAGWEPQPFDIIKNDVWCLGVVLFNMICGLTPWEKARESDVEFIHYLRHPLLLRQSLPISWRAFSLFLRIFDPNPETRITLDALKDELRNIDTFRMTPWEIEASTPGIRRAAEAWLPDTRRPRSQWTRYETYPEHLDPPRARVPSHSTLTRTCESLGSDDIVPCLDPCSEDETNPESVLVTPEALVGEPVQDEGCIPELDLADGLYAWSAGLKARDS